MLIKRLDLNLLHVFDIIYREGSLTRASQALHLTQPAVSHALARLRDHFQDPLFLRQGNRMVPTPTARRFADTVRPGLNQIHSALNQFHTFDPTTQQKVFNLALRDVLESTFLPPLLTAMQRWPNIQINSQRIARREMATQLASGTLDLAVDVLLPVGDTTAHERLREDRLVVVARQQHPIIEQGLTLDHYLAQRHILVSSRAEGPGIEDFELSRMGHKRDIALRCQHYFAACRVAEETDLLVTMPRTYAHILQAYLKIQVLDAPLAMPGIDIHLYWHKAYQGEPALIWMREQLHALMGATT